MSKDFWKPGEKTLFADMVGVSPSQFSDVLHRRKSLSYKRALKFEKVSVLMRKKIRWHDWVMSKHSKHPAFYGRRRKV